MFLARPLLASAAVLEQMQKLMMTPAPAERLLRFVGDRLVFTLTDIDGRPLPEGWRAFLRTNLGRAAQLRHEIIHAHTGRFALGQASWHDIPLQWQEGQWRRDLALTEVGYFRAKAYAVDPQGRQHWPDGHDVGISIHPDAYRTANTIYCAFIRMFGANRSAVTTQNPARDARWAKLDKAGYTLIPSSGKLRDLIGELPHIMDTLGCRILHLLPVTPTPTTYARFGRFGSPYAVQDFTAIDPALVEFDKRTTGVDQFCELTYATHLKGGRVFLDVVANHTGWGSTLQENHPEWFLRHKNGQFASPGAWGTTWEDLVELDHRNPALWEYLAEVFLIWCRRGVDGFRCDAGYKIPVRAWQYITARVLEEFPETIFLLEGLGGSWEATENLLTDGGMQWAYSELFQNYTGREVARYLDYGLRQSERIGLYVHYSETHDNERLARKSRAWSLLRNQLCALTSVSGGFGFTCGVEWLARERINVHSNRGMAWGSDDNLIPELAQLNKLLAEHPCFLDGAKLTRLSPEDSPVFALSRVSAEGLDRLLILVNTDVEQARPFILSQEAFRHLGEPVLDLLTGKSIKAKQTGQIEVDFTLEPGACHCLGTTETPRGLGGAEYRLARAQAAFALAALSRIMPSENIGAYDWRTLAARVHASPRNFLALLSYLDRDLAQNDLIAALDRAAEAQHFPKVALWNLIDARRITSVAPEHWLLVEDKSPFQATLVFGGEMLHARSVQVRDGHAAFFGPGQPGDAELVLERYTDKQVQVQARLRFLSEEPNLKSLEIRRQNGLDALLPPDTGLVLLTNGIGGMARMQVNLGQVKSKYDCVLGANLHPALPVDRHIFVKRVRVWVVADGFISALDQESLIRFVPGPPARWEFIASAGDRRAVEIHLVADMLAGRNTTVLRFTRPPRAPALGRDLPAHGRVSLTVRVDLVDRNFHSEMHRNESSELHFFANSHPLAAQVGFEFTPAHDRQLRVFSDVGVYHHEAEWSMGLQHPIEASRGQIAVEDAYSPGWFELPMAKDASATLTLTADPSNPTSDEIKNFERARMAQNEWAVSQAVLPRDDAFGNQLALAVQSFVVRRGSGKTVIAGYPWFLDWGRDSLICGRGLLSTGALEEVGHLLLTYGRFVENGTLPNTIHGEDASNRDTSDAPLWYGLVCEEAAEARQAHRFALKGAASGLSPEGVAQLQPEESPDHLYAAAVDSAGRTIADVLREIAVSYIRGTPNGIRMDPASGLIWSPSHFTWMDTNHPAGTPREGYPVEIQVLWIRLLRQLGALRALTAGESWEELASRAEASFHKYFWLEDRGYLADLLIAQRREPAACAQADTALRSNYLLAISLGLLTGDRARRAVDAALRYLLVPGAVRSLAPLPVFPPLPIRGHDGALLNVPSEPYWGHYAGEEDNRRKPAYHNGTAWVWTLPIFCEALARAWDFDPAAVAAAKAYLGSLDHLLTQGCHGQLPEIVDGDAPHTQRGCDAQAWSATEAVRVWKLLHSVDKTTEH